MNIKLQGTRYYLQFPPSDLRMLDEIEISSQVGEHMKQICTVKDNLIHGNIFKDWTTRIHHRTSVLTILCHQWII